MPPCPPRPSIRWVAGASWGMDTGQEGERDVATPVNQEEHPPSKRNDSDDEDGHDKGVNFLYNCYYFHGLC